MESPNGMILIGVVHGSREFRLEKGCARMEPREAELAWGRARRIPIKKTERKTRFIIF
jgi:hypothetical protein